MPQVNDLAIMVDRTRRPLYLAVRDAIYQAVESGHFKPGQRLPSTKEISEQLRVSLVTAHRAMQELVATGVLSRTQGRGTFVHQKYHERRNGRKTLRIGFIGPDSTVIEGYFRSQFYEGLRQATQQLSIDLLVLGLGEDLRNECNGLLLLNPSREKVESLLPQVGRKPTLIVGAPYDGVLAHSIDIDNLEMGERALAHLADLGHTNLGFMGGDDNAAPGRDRWRGFLRGAQEREVILRDQNVIRSLGGRLDERERMALIRALSGPHRPTALFAAGFDFAMDVYDAARTVGLRMPEDLSIIAVDDPPSAPHLAPAITTFRQPLMQLGHAALNALIEQIKRTNPPTLHRRMRAELLIRGSTAKLV